MSQAQKKFRYNGAELALMKQLAMTSNPQEAVEKFIETAISQMRDPQDLLAELVKAQPTDGSWVSGR